MRLFRAPPLFMLPALCACDPDCGDPSRMDGRHRVWSNVVEHSPPVDSVPEEYPATEIFYNGYSEWHMRYVASQHAFDLGVDDQKYSATYTRDPENCNAFQLAFGGVFVTASGARHDFSWAGDLVYFGNHLGGTWEYTSDWSDPATSGSGYVQASGELRATSADDTGL
ncbi:MAG: hypothetical protein ABIO70_35950 [Pseudomonadota bacterium]